MAIALIATILGPDSGNVGWIIIAMIIGGSIGVYLAKKVEMTEMPELVAVLHSFVGGSGAGRFQQLRNTARRWSR